MFATKAPSECGHLSGGELYSRQDFIHGNSATLPSHRALLTVAEVGMFMQVVAIGVGRQPNSG